MLQSPARNALDERWSVQAHLRRALNIMPLNGQIPVTMSASRNTRVAEQHQVIVAASGQV